MEKAGSRQIATSYDLTQYDFAFPAGVPAAEKMRREQEGSQSILIPAKVILSPSKGDFCGYSTGNPLEIILSLSKDVSR